MSTKRFIPVLLLDNAKRLVKTIEFSGRTYIGDPFNVIRLFNEREVDELVILDIDASTLGVEPDVGFLSELVSECFMPIAYGGGISTLDVAEKICRSGVEKIIIGRRVQDRKFITRISHELGSQSLVGCFDYRGSGDSARFVCGEKSLNLRESVWQAIDSGVGEVILQSIDRDGKRCGYDLETISKFASDSSVPIIALGGGHDLHSMCKAAKAGASAVASGSAFSFVGPLRAVLVNYPSHTEILEVLASVNDR